MLVLILLHELQSFFIATNAQQLTISENNE
jgi:hypothetical protein